MLYLPRELVQAALRRTVRWSCPAPTPTAPCRSAIWPASSVNEPISRALVELVTPIPASTSCVGCAARPAYRSRTAGAAGCGLGDGRTARRSRDQARLIIGWRDRGDRAPARGAC